MTAKAAILLAASTALVIPALAGAAPAKSAVAAAPAIPRQTDGKPDFSGIWQVLGEADYDLEPHAGRRDAPPGPGVVVV